MKKGNPAALLPIGIFLVLYLGLGILFEYVLKIPMGFYNIPIVVIFLIALLAACLQNRALSFDEKLGIMGKGIGDRNIVTMILIFMEAGIFVGVVGRSSAESVAYFTLSVIPARYAVVVLFAVSCFVSLAMGTSVGTITLISPIAVAVSEASGFNLPLCIASVIGGAMFGDNLSFISDTTIAACNGQGCDMKDKFRENFAIALPAALLTLVLILILSLRSSMGEITLKPYNLVQTIPYILVLIGGIIGINVFVVLLIGILSGAVIMLVTGAMPATALLSSMGAGAAGMFETTMVAAALTPCSTASRRSSAARRADSSAWACWSAPWISPPRTTRSPLSWPIPLRLTWQRTMASLIGKRRPCWIPSPVYFRGSSPTAPRCWSPFPPARSWANRLRPFRSFRICSTPSCCWSARSCSSS